MLAIEEMSRLLEEKTSGIILTTVIFSGATSLVLLGQYVFFPNNTIAFPWGRAWLIIPLCVILTGLMGGFFSLAILKGGDILKTLRFLSPLKVVFICGLIIALLSFLSDGSAAGTGYQETNDYLLDPDALPASYPFMRVLATLATFFVGMLQSPLTAFVIIMEMTNTHALLLPMMLTAFIVNGTSKLICPEALYQGLSKNHLSNK